jgi:hypothetical protein
MPNDEDLIRRGFVAERRNLIAVSLILFFYQSSEIVINKINVFGNDWPIRDPSQVSVALWIWWGYSLFRYYQYFRDLPDKGFLSGYRRKLNTILRTVSQRHFRRVFVPDDELKDSKMFFTFGSTDVVIESRNYLQLEMHATVNHYTKDGKTVGQGTTKKIELFWRHLIIPQIRAFSHVVLSTRLVTEYILPFLVALFPFWYLVLRFSSRSWFTFP